MAAAALLSLLSLEIKKKGAATFRYSLLSAMASSFQSAEWFLYMLFFTVSLIISTRAFSRSDYRCRPSSQGPT